MGWDTNTKPKPLRRKQKRMILWGSIIMSLAFVSLLGWFKSWDPDSSLSIITEVADTVLSSEEKRVVWDGMSKEGKAVIQKHVPIPIHYTHALYLD